MSPSRVRRLADAALSMDETVDRLNDALDHRPSDRGPHARNGRPSRSVEPVMTPGHTVTTHPADLHVEVRIGGETVAESDRPLLLEETGLPTRYYLPRDDVRMDRFRPTTFHTMCPFKGEASYWSIEVDGTPYDGIMWSYEEPIEGRDDITGLVAFYSDRAEVLVDGTDVEAA